MALQVIIASVSVFIRRNTFFQQTLLGGLLFDETMSPGTLNTNKERLQEAIVSPSTLFAFLQFYQLCYCTIFLHQVDFTQNVLE